MSTTSRSVVPTEDLEWKVPQSFTNSFRWEYTDGRDSLLALYEKGKRNQWNAAERIDWSQESAAQAWAAATTNASRP